MLGGDDADMPVLPVLSPRADAPPVSGTGPGEGWMRQLVKVRSPLDHLHPGLPVRLSLLVDHSRLFQGAPQVSIHRSYTIPDCSISSKYPSFLHHSRLFHLK